VLGAILKGPADAPSYRRSPPGNANTMKRPMVSYRSNAEIRRPCSGRSAGSSFETRQGPVRLRQGGWSIAGPDTPRCDPRTPSFRFLRFGPMRGTISVVVPDAVPAPRRTGAASTKPFAFFPTVLLRPPNHVAPSGLRRLVVTRASPEGATHRPVAAKASRRSMAADAAKLRGGSP